MNRLADDETEDDLTLPQRPRRPDTRYRRPDTREEMAREMAPEQDREFTLSTGTVLALFFALALICAVFFGFGYSMGRKSAVSSETASAATADTAPPEVVTPKPSAGSPAIQPIPGYLSQGAADAANRNGATPSYKPTTNADGTKVTIPTPSTTPAAKPAVEATDDSGIVEAPVAKPVVKPTPSTAVAPVAADPASATPVYVQIAAVSHQEDANVLLSALKRRGYSVFTRSSDADKLIHVQVGPFNGKKDAEVMRQKLLGDGYNAILK